MNLVSFGGLFYKHLNKWVVLHEHEMHEVKSHYIQQESYSCEVVQNWL